MMGTMFASAETPPLSSSGHRAVLRIVVVLAVAASLLIWLLPALGVDADGWMVVVLSSLVQMLWWSLLAFVVVSSAAVVALSSLRHAAVRNVLAYGAGVAAVVALFPVLDKFY